MSGIDGWEKQEQIEMPQMDCPKCTATYDDFDGLGVLYCHQCGYCKHASWIDGVCQFCGEKAPTSQNEKEKE